MGTKPQPSRHLPPAIEVLRIANGGDQGACRDVATAEYATLRLAALCGMSVPAVRLVDIGGKSVLLIRRFDRYWHEGQALPPEEVVLHETLPGAGAQKGRLPFVSGLTLLACGEFESRYKDYADLGHAVRRHVHPSHIRINNNEPFTRMVFNIFVSNDDDHLRNHGFVRDPRVEVGDSAHCMTLCRAPGSRTSASSTSRWERRESSRLWTTR